MLKVGITGGIGSGKSLIRKMFAIEGIPVYDADYAGKWLLNNDETVKHFVKKVFGDSIYDANGNLNRKEMANIVFGDKAMLKKLTDIVHPAVGIHSMEWFKKIKRPAKFAIKEAAVLFESGSYKALDKIITVTAPLELRVKRVMKRDRTSEEEVLKRAEKQMSDEEKIKKSDFVIENYGTIKLIPQVLDIKRQLE